MKDSKLIQILKSFTKTEFSEFEKFTASPFHNEGRNFSLIIRELRKHHPGFSSKNFTTENIFGKIYTGKTYSTSLVYTTLSRILKMAQEFLMYKSYRKNKLSAKYYYIHELLNRE